MNFLFSSSLAITFLNRSRSSMIIAVYGSFISFGSAFHCPKIFPSISFRFASIPHSMPALPQGSFLRSYTRCIIK